MKIHENSNEVEIKKRRNLWVLFFGRLFYGFGFGSFQVVYQPFLLEITGSIFITGILITFGGFMQFLPMPIIGKLSDRFGRKKLILFSIPFCILGLLLLSASYQNNSILLVIGILLFYSGYAIELLNSQILIAENSDKSKGLMYGLMFFSYFGGSIGGSYFVILMGYLSYNMYFLIFIGILIVELIIYLAFLSDPSKLKNPKGHNKNKTLTSELSVWRKIFQTPKIKIVLFFFAFDFFIYNISLSLYNGGLVEQYQFTKENIALLSVWFNISNMVFQIPAGRIADKFGKRNTIIASELVGFAMFSLCISAFFLWSNGFETILLPLLIIGQILLGLSASTFIPSEQMAFTELDEINRAESYGIVTFIKGLGFLPTGIIAGFLIDKVHYIAPFIITSIGIIFEIWFLLKYFRD